LTQSDGLEERKHNYIHEETVNVKKVQFEPVHLDDIIISEKSSGEASERKPKIRIKS
jgi:hypothetical protein